VADGTRALRVREFKTAVGGLLVLRDWLTRRHARRDGSHRRVLEPLRAVLEDSCELLQVNAPHVSGALLVKSDDVVQRWEPVDVDVRFSRGVEFFDLPMMLLFERVLLDHPAEGISAIDSTER
jgi:hypothetical protein